MITTINGKEYSINLNAGFLEIEFDNDVTGLRVVYVFKDLSVAEVMLKRAETVYYSYDITPTGQRINQTRHSYKMTEADFDDFENGQLGYILKRAITNGLFRFILKLTDRVFDENTLALIPEINTEG